MGFLAAVSIWLIPILIAFILMYGTYKQVATYEVFVEGAKEGFQMAISIIPYLVGMLVAISVFRASGAMDFLIDLLKPILQVVWGATRNRATCHDPADFRDRCSWYDYRFNRNVWS